MIQSFLRSRLDFKGFLVACVAAAWWLTPFAQGQTFVQSDFDAMLYRSPNSNLPAGFERGINWHSLRGVPLSSTAGSPVGSDGRASVLPPATPNQFGSAFFVSGVTSSATPAGLNPSASFAANAEALDWPRGSSDNVVKLVLRSQVGSPYFGRPVSFLFGSVISPPDTDENGVALSGVSPSVFWFAEPYSTDDHADARYYWSPSAKVIFANQSGQVSITWRKATPTATEPTDYGTNPSRYVLQSGLYFTLLKATYIVSGAPVKPPRKMYWTEGIFRNLGKPVTVPTARIGSVNFAYNVNFPKRVDSEYEAVGQSQVVEDPTKRLSETRTIWYDQTQGQILAHNQEGRVFMEILGDILEDGVTRAHLGFEIVDVAREANPANVQVELGERLTSFDNGTDDSHLFPEPLNQGAGQRFLFQHAVPETGRFQFFAVRETVNLNDVLVHWLEEGLEGLRWPFRFVRYQQIWPDDVSKYSHYVRPNVSSENAAKKTAVPLPIGNVPSIDYQDPLDRPRAKLTEKFEFYTFLQPAYPAHRTLLRFTSDEHIRFERVFSWLNENLRNEEFSDSIATSLTAWDPDSNSFSFPNESTAPRVVNQSVSVGERISAPSGELGGTEGEAFWAGHIRESEGTSFNIHAYVDPFVAGFEEANQGAIIPINSIPGKNELEAWWFRKNTVELNQGFEFIHWPSVISRYTINWPTSPKEIVLASNDGSGGLGSLEAKGAIYYQNNPNAAGYNPNEEHALMIGGQAFALRDDLNITQGASYSSAPFVLIEHQGSDERPAMTVFKVLREKPEAGILFDYVTEAGMLLQPPMPLPLLPKPVVESGDNAVNFNTEPPAVDGDLPVNWTGSDLVGPFRNYSRFTFQDRKNEFWVYRGIHTGLPALEMGTYNASTKAIEGFQSATAIVGEEFVYQIHTSRRIDSLLLTEGENNPLPSWLSISGLAISGNPEIADVGTVTVDLVLTDVGDDSEVTASLQLTVSETGSVVTQEKLTITSFNSFASANVTYNRPPYLAQSPTAKNSFTMRFYYRTQEGFAWPGDSSPPQVDSIVPYLRPKDSGGSFIGDPASRNTDSLDIVYRPVWPVNPPRLFLGDTLMKPKLGLPAVRGQTSIEVLYQQSIAADIDKANVSAVLHDPTRERFVDISDHGMDKLPASVRTDRFQGKEFFPNLPPHLVERLFFDPNRSEAGHLVFKGEFKDELFGEKYVLLNVLRGNDLQAVKDLTPSSDSDNKSDWDAAIEALATTLETFHENPNVPGTYIPDTDQNETVAIGDLAIINDGNTAVDSYALSASGPGRGFISLIAANGSAFTPPGDPISVHILRVDGPLVRGELKVLPSPNPLSELLTIQHTSDLAGRFDEFEYEWKIAPPVDGLPPVVDAAMTGWTDLASGASLPLYTLGGSGIQVLIDNYLVMRYRPTNPDHPLFEQWSDWTRPQLAEGWIKRVLAGINPFNQRLGDLFNNAVNTDVSLLTQAGGRWEGDVALNLANINDFGLIEIYETVLRRGKGLSIGAGINFGPANDALLLAAGYINDLYMMLGNEALADASNPTIGIGTMDGQFGDIATALFAFKGQTASLLEEELALLRGRDDFLLPGVEISPIYNRLVWNYTRGIDAGEVIYALNYNIQENPNKEPDGVINAEDAARMFPQGHGDAFGHYLTALKGYYSLLTDTDFDWVPRIEAVLVLGQPVSVDYLDERKFAAAAASVARSGKQIFDLTWKKDYSSDTSTGWQHFGATRTNDRRGIPTERYWGMDHWASRTAQGSFLNWVVGNSILPETDPDPNHEGIQKVDRTTVPELKELPAVGESLQISMDNAEGGSNPLGLPENSIPFDLNPQAVVGSEFVTHYEQINNRATTALNNAVVAFDEAKGVTRLMRSEQDSLADLQASVAAEELAFENALIELYGTPYPDDIGPGKTYSTGYSGPDLLHYMYVENPESTFNGLLTPEETQTFRVDIQQFPDNWYDKLFEDVNFLTEHDSLFYLPGAHFVEFTVGPHGFFGKPSTWSGQRKSPGRIQQAISDLIKVHDRLVQVLGDSEGAKQDLDKAISLWEKGGETGNTIRDIERGLLIAEQTLAAVEFAFAIFDTITEATEEGTDAFTETIKEALPKSLIFGTASGGDSLSGARGSVLSAASAAKFVVIASKIARFFATEGLGFATDTTARWIGFDIIAPLESAQEDREAVFDLAGPIGEVQGYLVPINERLRELEDALRNLKALEAEGDGIQLEREIFRQRAAALVQGFRTRDAAFRIFRNEKLERYKTLFDLASQYSFMAAKAFDYDTGLLHTERGKEFINRIIRARALGVIQDGRPQFAGSDTGDPGLSSALAEMNADWQVLRGRLGFNNPDDYGTTFSLRTENFRILPGVEGDLAWRDKLEASRYENLLDDEDVRRYAMQIDRRGGLPVPGLIIDFSTVIADGLNFFGMPTGPGDHFFNPSSFATKIFAAGVALEGYVGMDNPGANSTALDFAGGTSSGDPTVSFLDPNALAATPFIYLIPAGIDSMRSPPLGDISVVRTWSVDDVTIPMPFNIGGSEFSSKKLFQSEDSLTEELFGVRKHQAFRPVPSTALLDRNIYGGVGGLLPSPFTSSRLIGRSVWNSRWKLIIPGHTLLNDSAEGLDRFINSVKDIKVHLLTYSYAGN